DDQVVALQAPFFTDLEIILRHLLPAVGFGAADSDDYRTGRHWGMKKRTVLSGDLRGKPHLLVDADLHHHIEVIDAGGGNRALDQVSRQAFFLPVVSQSHGREMAARRVAGNINLRWVATVTDDVSVNPSDGGTGLAHDVRDRHV